MAYSGRSRMENDAEIPPDRKRHKSTTPDLKSDEADFNAESITYMSDQYQDMQFQGPTALQPQAEYNSVGGRLDTSKPKQGAGEEKASPHDHMMDSGLVLHGTDHLVGANQVAEDVWIRRDSEYNDTPSTYTWDKLPS
jgi:hypothetical protein